LNKAIKLDEKNAPAFYRRGIVNYLSGDRASACVDLSKAAELGMMEAYDVIKIYCR
jgi:hypothetical protein